MSTGEQLPSDPCDTPKTDAALVRIKIEGEEFYGEQLVRADFARAQERRISELETRLRYRVAVCNCSGHSKCGACQDDEVALL